MKHEALLLSVRDSLVSYNKALDQLAEQEKGIYDYLTDREVDVDERWEFWLDLPEETKTHHLGKPDIGATDPEVSWEDHFNCESLETYHVLDIMSKFRDNLEYGVSDVPPYLCGYPGQKNFWTQENYEVFQEFFLEKNMKSFHWIHGREI